MRLAILIHFLIALALLSEDFSFQLFQDFFPDGKYCLIQELKRKNETKHHQTCRDPIVIRTKYPYLIIWKEHQEKMSDHSIHVVKPESWSDAVDLKSKSEEDKELHFTLNNTSFHLHSHDHHHSSQHEENSMNFTLKLNDGILLVQSVMYKRVQTEHYCTMNNLVPGKWKYDHTFVFNTSDAWNTCPSFPPHSWDCMYHALQYFPDSNCHVLPLRQSLFLLYHYFHVEGLISNSTDSPYFFFMGDSLSGQLCITGRCELHSHANMILSQVPYRYNSSMLSLGNQARYKVHQFLRSDYPCCLACADETYRKKEGFKRSVRNSPGPCEGCPDGNISHHSPFDHPEFFRALQEIPLSVRVLVLDAGAWFTPLLLKGEDSTTIYKETLEALIPHLAYFQKQRNYEVDLYFLPLPGVDPSLAISPSHEWSKYEEKNQIMYNLFSPQFLAAHNLTITILPNKELFQRKHLIDGVTNVFLRDNLHYCGPGAFSPDSFLFELLAHSHVVRKFKLPV